MNPVSNFPRSDINGSSNAQDILEKRRRQIEKTRAANLSKQLQMRLRYARLKVEHGWQKQTLNEVENLYFHHYRGKAYSAVESNPISKPKKAPPREKVHANPKADKDGNATASGSSGSTTAMAPLKDSLLTQTPTSMDGHHSSASHPQPFPIVEHTTSSYLGDMNSVSSTSAPSTEAYPGNKPAALESSSPRIHDQSEIPGSNTSGTTSASLSPTPRLESPVSLNRPKSGIIPTSSATQSQTSIAGTSTSTSYPTASSALAIPNSPYSGSTTTYSTHARAPSKLPIPRLPAVSYPYTGVTSPASVGKARKGTQLSAGSTASRYSLSSSSTATVPPLSPYKHSYASAQLFPLSPSTSTALQTTPSGSSLAGNSSESSSLPLTYDSFWSSHTSSSSLPSSYRTNPSVNSSFTFSTLSTTSSTLPASSTSTPLPTASTSMPSPNFPFTSFHNSSSSSLSHSPMVPSLLHSPGLVLFQQAVHSPPTVGASNQNATVG